MITQITNLNKLIDVKDSTRDSVSLSIDITEKTIVIARTEIIRRIEINFFLQIYLTRSSSNEYNIKNKR